MKKIYLDNNASTPLHPMVVQEITKALTYPTLNPSSPHKAGQEARALLDLARREAASYFGVPAKELIFTSSGTEAMNFLIKSALSSKPGILLSSETEHSAVFNLAKSLPNSILLKNSPSLEEVEKALTPDVTVIALMAVNNETGVKTDIRGIADLALSKKIHLIVDGVAWLGKDEIIIPKGVSGIGFSGHKIHAPGGVGCAIFKSPLKPFPIIVGGSQEYGYRAGTENMISILGFVKALNLLKEVDFSILSNLRDSFESQLKKLIPSCVINGSERDRIGNTSSVLFPGIDAESLMMNLDQAGIACSMGSACTSGAIEPSRILLSMGLSYKEAKSSLRFSFSRLNTLDEVDSAVKQIITLLSPQ